MNKIRVIDLLNKIANGEEVPKKIKHGATVFILDYFSTENKEAQYISENYKKVLLEGLSTTMCLNDEVEIIEEEKEIENQFTHIYNCSNEKNIEVNFQNIQTTLEDIIKVINDMRDKEWIKK